MRATRRLLVFTLGALALGQIVMSLAGADLGDINWRPSGTLGNPNALGAVAGALALALAALGRWRLAGLAAALPLVLLLVASRSRGAALAFGSVSAVLAWRRFGARAVLIMAAGAALLVFVPNPLWERITSLRAEHAFSRPFLWGVALHNLVEAPLGIGPGMNRYVFPADAWDPSAHWLLHQRHAVGLTHNVLLTLGLEWGWAALAAALGLLAWAGARLWSRRPPDALGQAGALGAAVLLVECQVDALAQNPVAFSLCLLLGAVARGRLPRRVAGSAASGAASGTAPVGDPATAGAGLSGKVAAGGALLAAALLLTATARHQTLLADIGATDALLSRYAAGQVEVGEVRDRLTAVVAAWPDAPPGWSRWMDFEEARLRERLEAGAGPGELAPDVERMHRVMQGARRASPRDVGLARQCADVLLLLHRSLERRDGITLEQTPLLDAWWPAMEALLALDPLDVEARLRVALEAQGADRPGLRDKQMAELLRLEPDYAWAWLVRARHQEVDGRWEAALHAWLRAREALLNCRIHARVDEPRSRRFYLRNLDLVDLTMIQRRIVALRRQLYF